jgi:hypothetical protein
VDSPIAIISAYLDDDLTRDQHRDLLAWISESPDNRRQFAMECYLHSGLQDILAGAQMVRDMAVLQMSDVEQTLFPNPVICDLPADQSSVSPPSFTPFLSNTFHGTAGWFSSGWPVAYLIATVVVGIGMLIGSLVHVSDLPQVARQSAPPPSFLPSVVGRITGMVDCQWVQSPESRVQSSALNSRLSSLVSLGDKFVLTSGLMEITYDSGAKVILQGPVTYEVESAAGGYLVLGKLTARVEKVASGQWPVASKSEMSSLSTIHKPLATSSNPQSLIPNPSLSTTHYPLFTIKTPTATVTDLGTEFGVEVDREGNHDIQVFVGKVNVQLPPEHGRKPREIHLTENHAIRFLAASNTVANRVTAPERFVRKLKRPEPPQVIGVNFTHGNYSNLTPEEVTGVVQAGWWNNVDGDPLPPPTVPPLHDAAGKKTSARLSWQWSYSGAALPYRTYWNYYYEGTPAVYPFEKLLDGVFNGVVERNTQTTVRTPVTLTIGVSGVPYHRYRVYVYYSTRPASDDVLNPLMHTFGLSINGSKPLIVSRPKFWLNDFYRYQSETQSGNYQVFENLSGDLTIRATPDGPGPLHDKFIAGFQIVETSQ